MKVIGSERRGAGALTFVNSLCDSFKPRTFLKKLM